MIQGRVNSAKPSSSKNQGGGRPPELVIFDFDGTLADTWPWLRDQLAAGADEIGYRRKSSAEIEELRGRDTQAVLNELGITGDTLLAVASHLTHQAEQASGSFRLFKDIPALLEDLAEARIALAIVSSNSERVVHAVLGARLARLFSAGRFGAAVFDKASAFQSIVMELGIDPAMAVAVGDETRDIEAAAAAAVRAIAVEWGFAHAALLKSVASGSTAPDVKSLRSMLLDDLQSVQDR